MIGGVTINKRKYSISLFISGLLTDIIFRYFFLFVPSFILIILGIFNEYCLIIGLAILIIDLITSFIDQLKIMNAFMKDSDNPDFQEFQDALSQGGDWKENLRKLFDERIKEDSDEDQNDQDR